MQSLPYHPICLEHNRPYSISWASLAIFANPRRATMLRWYRASVKASTALVNNFSINIYRRFAIASTSKQTVVKRKDGRNSRGPAITFLCAAEVYCDAKYKLESATGCSSPCRALWHLLFSDCFGTFEHATCRLCKQTSPAVHIYIFRLDVYLHALFATHVCSRFFCISSRSKRDSRVSYPNLVVLLITQKSDKSFIRALVNYTRWYFDECLCAIFPRICKISEFDMRNKKYMLSHAQTFIFVKCSETRSRAHRCAAVESDLDDWCLSMNCYKCTNMHLHFQYFVVDFLIFIKNFDYGFVPRRQICIYEPLYILR